MPVLFITRSQKRRRTAQRMADGLWEQWLPRRRGFFSEGNFGGQLGVKRREMKLSFFFNFNPDVRSWLEGMLSSSSESEDAPAGPDEAHGMVKEESEEERTIEPVWRQMRAVEEEIKVNKEEVNDAWAAWVPVGVTEALKKSKTFKEYQENRVFKFLHFFSGPKDVLGQAIERMAGLQGIQVQVASLDIAFGDDLSGPQPFNDFLELARTGDLDSAYSGFPCGSFSRARYREGTGPPPVRSGQWIYGLDSRQQAEADKGSLLAIRSTQVVGDLLQSQRLRKVPDCGTLGNPPGSEDQQEGPAWCLPEAEKFMKDFDGETAEFNTCGFQQKERVRWWKPGKIGGKLPGMRAFVVQEV